MFEKLDWESDGVDWPNREASRFVRVGRLKWHVQVMGQGPTLLLVHGTGAATHSWRDLAPRLAKRFRVIAPDLPGHGFTSTPSTAGFTLPGMAHALGDLIRALDETPVYGVGHSAGAALLIRMALDGVSEFEHIVSLNGALLPIRGFGAPIFSPLAKALTWNPLIPWLVSWRAQEPRAIASLLRDTGSEIDDDGLEFYRRLASKSNHVQSALRMMANWDLDSLEADLPRLRVPISLVVGEKDRFVSPRTAERVERKSVLSTRIIAKGMGHLAHEERPDEIAEIILNELLPRRRRARKSTPMGAQPEKDAADPASAKRPRKRARGPSGAVSGARKR